MLMSLLPSLHFDCHTGASHSSSPEKLVEHVFQAIQDLKKPKRLEEVRLIASNRELFDHMATMMSRLVPPSSKQPAKPQQESECNWPELCICRL